MYPYETDLVPSLLATTWMHRRAIENAVRGLGIHHSQHRMLMHLFSSDTPPSQKELAAQLHISPAAVANAIKKLEIDGYVTRVADRADGRRNRVAVTPRGVEILDSTKHLFDRVNRTLKDGLSQEELDTLLRCFARMRSNLSDLVGETPKPPIFPPDGQPDKDPAAEQAGGFAPDSASGYNDPDPNPNPKEEPETL